MRVWYWDREIGNEWNINLNFADMEFSDDELKDVKVLGKAIAFQSDVK